MTEIQPVNNSPIELEYENFDDDIAVMQESREAIQEIFKDTKEHLKTMFEVSKRKGSGVSLGFIHAQTANLAALASASISASKAIIDTKQKRFNNRIKVNPIKKEDNNDVPHSLLRVIHEHYTMDSGAIAGVIIEHESSEVQDIDKLLEQRLNEQDSNAIISDTRLDDVLESPEHTETEESINTELKVVVGTDGKMYLIDSFYKTYNSEYDVPEDTLELLEDDYGVLYAEYEGERLEVIDTNFLE